MMLLGAIVSLCYVPGVTGAFIATQWAVLSILLPLALWRSGPFTVFHVLGLCFLGYAAVRVGYAPIFADGVFGLWLVCIMGLSFWFGSTLDSLRNLYAGLAIGAAVSSAVSVAQAFGFQGVATVSTNPAGLYVNSVAQGLILSVLVVALVSERMWLWALPLLPGIALSGSRGAWLALAIGLASVYVRRVQVLGVVAVAGALFLFFSKAQSDTERLLVWDAAWQNLNWLGWGTGSFTSWLLTRPAGNFYPEYAHNDALQIAFEYGAFAALPLGIFAFALTRTAEREWPVIVVFVVAGCYSMPLWIPIVSFVSCVAAGRVVRNWALARSVGNRRGQYVVSRQHSAGNETSCGAVPVVAHS